jgi:hypothetical protein
LPGGIADRLTAHHPNRDQLLQQRTHSMVFTNVQIGAELLQILAYRKCSIAREISAIPACDVTAFQVKEILDFP